MRALLIVLLFPSLAWSTITRVQCKHTYPATSGSAIAFASNNTAGNLLIVSATGTNSTNYTVTDSNNSYSCFAFKGGGNAGQTLDTMRICYVLSAAAGANSVTVTDTSGNDMGVNMCEYSTSAGTWSVDSSQTSGTFKDGFPGGSTTSQITDAANTAGSDDLIFIQQSDEATTQATHTTTPGSLSEIQWDNGHVDGTAEWLDAAAQTNVQFGWNVATSAATWSLYLVAFTASGGGGGGSTSPGSVSTTTGSGSISTQTGSGMVTTQ